MFYSDKSDNRMLSGDVHDESRELCDGRRFEVKPDMPMNYRDLPSPDETFRMIMLDPPHLRGRNAPPTDTKIKAGTKAFHEALKPDPYPQWDSDCTLRTEYHDAIRPAVKTMQGKTTEDTWHNPVPARLDWGHDPTVGRTLEGGQPITSKPSSFKLFIPGIPASKGSYRPITGRSRTTGKPVTRLIPMDKKERPWRDHVRDTILDHQTPTIPHDSYVTVETTFYLPRPKTIPPRKRKHPTVKPDIDKLQRALYDAITETHIWHDDCQITDVISHKRYADNTPTGVSLTITWERNQ